MEMAICKMRAKPKMKTPKPRTHFRMPGQVFHISR